MNTAPDKSAGGTFTYDAEGNFVSHEPPTKPVEAVRVAAETAARKPDATASSRGKSATKE